MGVLKTDYLIIGAGASGLAFADTLLDQSDAEIVIVDRHDRPGGHWNDAYPFVRLHQPSSFYGVNSLELWDGTIDRDGPNAGMLGLASSLGNQALTLNRLRAGNGQVVRFRRCRRLVDRLPASQQQARAGR